jgi:alpha-L-rhamnosidase
MTDITGLTRLDDQSVVASLRTQHGPGLLGVPAGGLRLTWQVTSGRPGAAQVGYQVSDGPEGGELAPRDAVVSADSVAVPVGDLRPGERRHFAVRVATDAGWTPWSEPLVVEAAPALADLRAVVVGIPTEVEGPVQLLRTTFAVDELPQRARLRLSALGLVDAWINGQKATDAVLTPGWTAYQERVLLDTLDVTGLLREGENSIVLAVGDGWYRGRFGFANRTKIYGDRSGALAQVDSEQGVHAATDATWRGGFGAVRFASLYDGATTDLREAADGVHRPNFDDSGWRQVDVVATDLSRFEPRATPPIRVVAELPMVNRSLSRAAARSAAPDNRSLSRAAARSAAPVSKGTYLVPRP